MAVLSRSLKNLKCEAKQSAKKKSKKEQKISQRIHQLTLNIMNQYLKFPSAPNSLYNTRDINTCLLQLSIKENYAQGELVNLQLKLTLPSRVPTCHTFRNKIETLNRNQVQQAFTAKNIIIFDKTQLNTQKS